MVFIVFSLTIGREHFIPDISSKVSDIIVNENETDEMNLPRSRSVSCMSNAKAVKFCTLAW